MLIECELLMPGSAHNKGVNFFSAISIINFFFILDAEGDEDEEVNLLEWVSLNVIEDE